MQCAIVMCVWEALRRRWVCVGSQGRTRQSLAPTSRTLEGGRRAYEGSVELVRLNWFSDRGPREPGMGTVGCDQGGRGHFGNSALGC
ncbi:hypothetical protein LIA77_07309 [Sarocladium implicatum]|nr:hypothetical protein LIA77_07309 [Sarocladium implicatum]